ncbi:dihydroneopterin aldolase [bacterium DOLJORAL78_65_58]|nr:MAG: dihydroneopterin aldolase [bacterium DOLZORAL124_64_63]PIE75721.1 MAG: dihydroneopterin aldolase [bacterium DOLJORAL78_65_58]
MDRVQLTGIRVQARHGVLPAEKRKPQWFRVSVSLFADCEAAARHDDLNQALDYARVHAVIVKEMQERSFELLEAVAGHLCRRVLEAVPAREVAITVVKENPPIADFAGEAAVTLRRDRVWLEGLHG